MKKLYTKFPLILLTLLNYAPYTYTTKKKHNTIQAAENTEHKKTKKKKSKKELKREKKTITSNEEAAIASTTDLITSLAQAEVDAQALINDFINSEIPENFETFFETHFSKNILQNNEEELSSLFSQIPLVPTIQSSSTPFAVEEFEKQLQAKLQLKEDSLVEITAENTNYHSIVPLRSFASLGCNGIFRAIINPEHNILLLHFQNDQTPNLSYISLINTKTLVSTLIPCSPENEIKAIGLLSDCSELSIMRADDKILSYRLPADLINFTPSIKQRAFITYIDAQMNMLTQTVVQNGFNDMIKAYARLPFNMVYKLAVLIENNKNLLPESLHPSFLNEKINSLQHILMVSSNAKFVADTLNIDVDTLADKMASNEITQEQVLAILSPDQSAAQ